MHGLQTIKRLNAEQAAEVERLTSPAAIAEAERKSAETLERHARAAREERQSHEARVQAFIERLKQWPAGQPLNQELQDEAEKIDPWGSIRERFLNTTNEVTY